jgi:hypothetical protein
MLIRTCANPTLVFSVGIVGHDPFSKDPPQVIYNPAGDVINQQLIEGFKAQVSAWNARAQVIQAAIQKIIESQKAPEGKK